jgi:hypothetical protein
MSGIWTEDDLRSTIPFEEIEVLESEADTPDDLLDELPHDREPIEEMEPTVARLPHQISEERPTRRQANWDLTPPLSTAEHRTPTRARVHDEVTAVRTNPLRSREERYWVDAHAVVDREGKLTLSPRVARQLPEGAVVEIRIARWALEED